MTSFSCAPEHNGDSSDPDFALTSSLLQTTEISVDETGRRYRRTILLDGIRAIALALPDYRVNRRSLNEYGTSAILTLERGTAINMCLGALAGLIGGAVVAAVAPFACWTVEIRVEEDWTVGFEFLMEESIPALCITCVTAGPCCLACSAAEYRAVRSVLTDVMAGSRKRAAAVMALELSGEGVSTKVFEQVIERTEKGEFRQNSKAMVVDFSPETYAELLMNAKGGEDGRQGEIISLVKETASHNMTQSMAIVRDIT
mmetsp:Transcript_10593/g.23348  ORF Transcript_10593/g.23348 Transcript_10593/m.23348 type:complete len:258 (-) Transcript_10593:179-952(-)